MSDADDTAAGGGEPPAAHRKRFTMKSLNELVDGPDETQTDVASVADTDGPASSFAERSGAAAGAQAPLADIHNVAAGPAARRRLLDEVSAASGHRAPVRPRPTVADKPGGPRPSTRGTTPPASKESLTEEPVAEEHAAPVPANREGDRPATEAGAEAVADQSGAGVAESEVTAEPEVAAEPEAIHDSAADQAASADEVQADPVSTGGGADAGAPEDSADVAGDETEQSEAIGGAEHELADSGDSAASAEVEPHSEAPGPTDLEPGAAADAAVAVDDSPEPLATVESDVPAATDSAGVDGSEAVVPGSTAAEWPAPRKAGVPRSSSATPSPLDEAPVPRVAVVDTEWPLARRMIDDEVAEGGRVSNPNDAAGVILRLAKDMPAATAVSVVRIDEEVEVIGSTVDPDLDPSALAGLLSMIMRALVGASPLAAGGILGPVSDLVLEVEHQDVVIRALGLRYYLLVVEDRRSPRANLARTRLQMATVAPGLAATLAHADGTY